MMDSFVMRIERITAQAVNRGIHEAHSQVRRLCSNDLSNSYTAREKPLRLKTVCHSPRRNLFAEREWDPEFARVFPGSVP